MKRKLKQSNCSSFQLEELGILTAHEKAKQMKLWEIKAYNFSLSLSISLCSNAMQDDGREICKCMDTCYLRAPPPPSWLIDRVQGDPNSPNRKPDFPNTAFEAVPLYFHGWFVAACSDVRYPQHVGWEFLRFAASFHECRTWAKLDFRLLIRSCCNVSLLRHA